jgi:hypothetical protein
MDLSSDITIFLPSRTEHENVGVSFQVPPSAAQFELNSEYAILQLSRRLAVLVGYDLIGGRGLGNRDCWQNADQQEATKSL